MLLFYSNHIEIVTVITIILLLLLIVLLCLFIGNKMLSNYQYNSCIILIIPLLVNGRIKIIF